MNQNIKSHILLFFASLIYGVNYHVTKFVVPDHIGPFGAIVLRVFFAGILFFIVQKAIIRESVKRKDMPLLALCALFGVAINQMMFFKGLSITTAINGSVIMTSTPILVLVVSAIIIREKVTRRKIIGILLGASGAILLIGGKDFSFNSDTLWGDVFVFINALSYGVYLVIVKPLTKKYQPLTIVKWTFIFGLFMVTPFGMPELLQLSLDTITSEAIWGMAFIILGTTFTAYLINATALKYVNPSLVGFYIYLQPVFASLISLYLGLDTLSIQIMISSVMIFAGVYLVGR